MATEITLPPRYQEIQDFLEGSQGAIGKAADKYMTPERVIQVAMLCAFKTPKLLDCDRSSLRASIIQACSLGLDLSPSKGEAYLIPRHNKEARVLEAQFQPGYRGLAKLARQAGGIRYLQAELVHANDQFDFWRDPDQRIIHRPCLKPDRGPVTHAYAVAKLATGELQACVMTFDEIEAVRRCSQKPDYGPWKEQWGEMAKKSVVKRLCKMLPDSADPVAARALNEAIEIDNRDYVSLEDAAPAAIDNKSGFGKGMYASQEQADAYLAKLDGYLAQRNAEWIDSWTKEGGIVPDGIKDILVTRWQADGHLVKWGVETGRLAAMDVTEGIKNRQIGRFTAIIYHRSTEDRKALAQEMRRYFDTQVERAMDRLRRERPELFNDVSSDEPVDPDSDFQPWELEAPADEPASD